MEMLEKEKTRIESIEDDLVPCLEASANDCISRPFDQEELNARRGDARIDRSIKQVF